MSCRLIFVVIALFLGATASARPESFPLHIAVLSEESQQFEGPPLDRLNCDFHDINAYCSSSRPKTCVEKTMIVRASDAKSMEIACTVYSRWSHCTTLAVNQSFEARMKKHNLQIRYLDQHGKRRTQVYEIPRKSRDEVGRDASAAIEEEM